MVDFGAGLKRAKREGWSEWIKSAADERAVADGCWFDLSEAVGSGRHVVKFFQDYLRHTMGPWAGKPFTLLDWQRDAIIMPLFSWRRANGLRRFTKGDIFTAKKQGKSTISAGIVTYFLLTSGRRAEVYGVAHTREQAGIIFREAEAMVGSSPMLQRRIEVLASRKRLVNASQDSFYQALAGENGAKGAEGINPVLILVDEIHVQRDRVLYDALAYASAARQNALMLSVSTVGVEDQTTIWWEQYEYAKKLIAGTITDTSRFAYISQADEACKTDDDLCGDPRQWAKAMPSLGVTVTEEKMHEYYTEARNSPAKMGNFRRYLLNIPTAQIERCIPMDKWEACSIEKHGGVMPDLEGRDCIGGLDVASHEDLSSFVLYFPPESEGEPGYLKTWFFCPEEKIRQREQKQQAHYVQWAADGDLIKTPGARIEHGVVMDVIKQAIEKYNVMEIAYDQWNADAIVNPLTNDGVEMAQIVQGFNGMSPGCMAFLDLIIEGGLIHDANPVMTWCCSNVAADTLHDAIKFNKSKSADKIDGAIAAAMAIGRAVQLNQDTAYDSPGQGVVLL